MFRIIPQALLVLCLLLSSLAYAQNSLTVTVDSSGAPLEGVAIFFYDSEEDYPRCEYCLTRNLRLPGGFESVQYTNSQGQVTFPLSQGSVGDSVFWATRDCNGEVNVKSAYYSGTGGLTETLPLSCRPSHCAVKGRVIDNPQSSLMTYEVYAYLKASTAKLPPGSVDWSYDLRSAYGTRTITRSGNNVNDDYDTIMIARKPYWSIWFSRDNFQCIPPNRYYSNRDSIEFYDLGSWSPNGAPFATAMFTPSQSGSGGTASSLVLLEQSSVTRGSIVQWNWRFDAQAPFGGSYNTRLPTHTYDTKVGSYRVILTIMAVDGNDTSYSSHADIIRFDANGNGSFKQNTPFNVQVIDGGSVGLEESVFKDVFVYPNPSRGAVQFSLPESHSISKITLFNSSAIELKKWKNPKEPLQMADLQPGIYLLELRSSHGVKRTFKLMIE